MIDQIIEYITLQLQENQFFSGAVVLTFLGSLIYSLKTIPVFIWTRIRRKIEYHVTIIELDDLFIAVEQYLSINYQKSYRNVEAVRNGFAKHDKSEKRGKGDTPTVVEHNSGKEKAINGLIEIHKDVIYKQFEDSFLIWSENWPILIKKYREKLDNANNIFDVFLNQFHFSSINKKAINILIEKMNLEYEKTLVQEDSISIYINDYGSWMNAKKCYRDIDTVVINNKQSLINDIDAFLKLTHLYEKLGVPFKRGYLLYGPPGNGKTSLCAAIATKFNRNIYYLNLRAVTDDAALQRLFRDIGDNSILVLEDIDCAFKKGRKSNADISFSGLLNCLDGIFYKEGLITIMTTNHIDKLDNALIRTGRIDYQLHIEYPQKSDVEAYLKMAFKTDVVLGQYNNSKSMSDIAEICIKNNQAESIKLIEK